MIHFCIVSILVVVDFPLRQTKDGAWCVVVKGFNPCCGGFSSKTEKQFENQMQSYNVSILVVVDFPLRRLKPKKSP